MLSCRWFVKTSLIWYTILFHYKWLTFNQSVGVETPLISLLFCLARLRRTFEEGVHLSCEFESTLTYLNAQRRFTLKNCRRRCFSSMKMCPGSKCCISEHHSMTNDDRTYPTETGKTSVEYSVACSLYLDLKWIG